MTHSERRAWKRLHDEDRRSMQCLGASLLFSIATFLIYLMN